MSLKVRIFSWPTSLSSGLFFFVFAISPLVVLAHISTLCAILFTMGKPKGKTKGFIKTKSLGWVGGEVRARGGGWMGGEVRARGGGGMGGEVRGRGSIGL
jgi:hypothetical protein